MSVKALIFDLYGTLVNIRTDEQDPTLYSELSKFLSYSHVNISPEELREEYLKDVRRCLSAGKEQYPEVDVRRIFTGIVGSRREGKAEPRTALIAARLFRSLSRKNFEPFPGVYGMLERLREQYPMALLSDAQRCFTEPEINQLKLGWFFDHIFLSSDYGFRKPEPKYFRLALDALGVAPEEAVYVGDNAFRDLWGAKKAGMRMVLVRSDVREYEGVKPD
ncbi:MAG: HAD family hydrolase, partial [Nitrospirota bacterium]